MIYRLTIGENGTPWGKQKVVISEEAENAIEFAKACLDYTKASIGGSEEDARSFLNACWIDAGSNTIGIAVQNLVF